MDVVHPWTLDVDGQPRVDATTFSVCMANRQSGGQLAVFVDGLKAVETLPEVGQWESVLGGRGLGGASSRVLLHAQPTQPQPTPTSTPNTNQTLQNARILVAEACNHNRITQACNDIGLVQVPAALHRLAPSAGGLRLDHAFGRDLPAVFGGSGSGGGGEERESFLFFRSPWILKHTEIAGLVFTHTHAPQRWKRKDTHERTR